MLSPRVAVLYSGRFIGDFAPAWIENHMRHLIEPLHASVFVVAEPSSWCHATSQTRGWYENATVEMKTRQFPPDSAAFHALDKHFKAAVRAAFPRWSDVHAMLLPFPISEASQYPHSLRGLFNNASIKLDMKVSPFLFKMVQHWYRQFSHVVSAERLRRRHGPHDVIIRARMDTMFAATSRLPTVQPTDVFGVQQYRLFVVGQRHNTTFAESTYSANLNRSELGDATPACARSPETSAAKLARAPLPTGRSAPPTGCAPFWTDWFFVAGSVAMDAFVDMVDPNGLQVHSDPGLRCGGMCQEEQTILQLEARLNLSVRALPWTMCLMKSHGMTPTSPLIQRATTCAQFVSGVRDARSRAQSHYCADLADLEG